MITDPYYYRGSCPCHGREERGRSFKASLTHEQSQEEMGGNNRATSCLSTWASSFSELERMIIK